MAPQGEVEKVESPLLCLRKKRPRSQVLTPPAPFPHAAGLEIPEEAEEASLLTWESEVCLGLCTTRWVLLRDHPTGLLGPNSATEGSHSPLVPGGRVPVSMGT